MTRLLVLGVVLLTVLCAATQLCLKINDNGPRLVVVTDTTLLTCEDRGGTLEYHLYDEHIVTQCDGAERLP